MSRAPSIAPSRDLGARFRWVREHLPEGSKLQVDVARDLEGSVSHYSKIEVGMVPVAVRFARDFCRRYSVSYEWLSTGKGEPWLIDAPPVSAVAADGMQGASEHCRELVFRAVAETARSLSDPTLMKPITALATTTGKQPEDVLGWIVWDRIRPAPAR